MSSLKVKVAILVTIGMLVSVSHVVAEEVGTGYVLQDSQPADQWAGEVMGEPKEAEESADNAPPAPPSEQIVIHGRDGRDGQDGHGGRDGKDGRNGRDGRNGQDGKTIVREGHQGHKAVYQEVKDWNPASCSRLDAKLTQNSTEDQAFARGLVEGAKLNGEGEQSPKEKVSEAAPPAPTTPSPTVPHHDRDWHFPWWLLFLLAILGAAWLWWRYWRHPVLINTASFFANRWHIGDREARVRVVPGCRQDCSKQVRNVSAGERYFQARTEANPGDTMEYQLRTRNDAHTPLHASGVWVLEDLPEGLVFLPGTGRAYIGHRWERTADGGWGADRSVIVPDWAIQQLLAGRALRMDQIPGLPAQIPGRNSQYLVFRAEVSDETEAEADVNFVIPPQAAQAAAQPPAQPAQAETAEPQPQPEPAEEHTDEPAKSTKPTGAKPAAKKPRRATKPAVKPADLKGRVCVPPD